MYLRSQNAIYPNLTSRLKITFPLDGGAYIFVIKVPIYMMITQKFVVSHHHRRGTSKTLTVSNQHDVPIKQNLPVTCDSSLEKC